MLTTIDQITFDIFWGLLWIFMVALTLCVLNTSLMLACKYFHFVNMYSKKEAKKFYKEHCRKPAPPEPCV